MKQPSYTFLLTAPADRDFTEIMDWTVSQFGASAAGRYETLIIQALTDVGENPFRLGAKQRPELLDGLYTYYLASSRERVPGERVKTPRRLLLYRVISSRVEVLRILHDSRDLGRHMPEL